MKSPASTVTYMDLNFLRAPPKLAATSAPTISKQPSSVRENRTNNIEVPPIAKTQPSNAIGVRPNSPQKEVSSTELLTQGIDKHLDLENIRQTAREEYRRSKRGEIEQMQLGFARDQSLEKKFGEQVKRAERKDCRNAFGGAGPIGLIPLALSTVIDVGCKW